MRAAWCVGAVAVFAALTGSAYAPMPTVTAPFAGKSVGVCARQPLRFAADGVTAARGEGMEFDAKMFRLRIRRRGEPFMMLWPHVAGGDMPWGTQPRTNRIARVLGADGAVTRTAAVPFKEGLGSFRQIVRSDGPGRCLVETDVRTPGADQNGITGFTVLWEDNTAWRFGTIRVTGASESKAFTGESIVVRDPVRISYETGEPDGTCAVEFPAGLFSSAHLHIEKDGVHASLTLAKACEGDPVSLVYDFGEKAVPPQPGPESVNGTDFRAEGDMTYICWDRRHNVLANPSFESDNRYWRGGTVRTDQARSGRRSMEASPAVRSFALPMAAAATNVVSFWARSLDGKAHDLKLELRHWNRSDPELPKFRRFKVPGGADWTRFEYAFFEPRPAAAICFSGKGVVIDDVQAECGTKASAYTMPPWGFALENAGEDPYFADAKKPIDAKLVFRGPAGAKGSLDVKVVSFFDEETFAQSFPFALDATGETRLALPDAAFLKGANTIVVTVRPTSGADDLRPFTDHVRFSVYTFADGTAKNRTLHQYSSIGSHERSQLEIPESYFRMMKTTGIAPRCRSIQDNIGVYPPELAKAIIKRYTDIGGMTVGYVWADSVRHGKAQFTEKLKARGLPNPAKETTIPDPDAFVKAVEEVTEEIVRAAPWAEVWIGPDEITGYWKCMSTDDGTLAAKVLMAMHRGVKKGNPKATFICYSTCNSGETARAEYRNFFAAAKKFDPTFKFDAVDPHPYRCFYEGVTDVDADWSEVFKTLDDSGQPQCVCYSFGGGYVYPLYLMSWNNIAPWSAIPQKDASNLIGLPGYAMGWGERVAAAMQLRFNLAAYKHAPRLRTNTNWVPWSIDMLNPHAPNVATAAQTELLGDARIYRDVRFAPESRAYVFDDGHGHATAAFWKFSKDLDRGRERGVTIALDLSKLEAELFDMMGNRRSAPVDASGRTVLPLSNFPVYVRVPREQADALAAAFQGCCR